MKLSQEHRVTTATDSAASLLCELTTLPKARIKDAMTKGAVSLKRGKQTRRIRRANTPLKVGDVIALYYDDALLSLTPASITCITDQQGYSIWFKPAGIMTQGNEFGDHLSLLRLVELHFEQKRDVFLIHRLDRETQGLVIIAHNKTMAAAFSQLLQTHRIEKRYHAQVLGEAPEHCTIDQPLDGKRAVTHVTRLAYNLERNVSLVDVLLETGRTHQIRRHLDRIGHPIIGDPRYGKGNKNRAGLQLMAYQLAFDCPLSGKPVAFSAPTLLADAD